MYNLVSDQVIKLSKTMYDLNFVEIVKLKRVFDNRLQTSPYHRNCNIHPEKMTSATAATQVFSTPELMKMVYEFDATYHVPYAKCLREVSHEADHRVYLRMGRKLLDTYMKEHLHELGYTFVKIVSYDMGKVEREDDDDDDDMSVESDDDTSSDVPLLETSFCVSDFTVLCQIKLPDNDVVKMFEAYFHYVSYDKVDQRFSCSYHTLSYAYSEDR